MVSKLVCCPVIVRPLRRPHPPFNCSGVITAANCCQLLPPDAPLNLLNALNLLQHLLVISICLSEPCVRPHT